MFSLIASQHLHKAAELTIPNPTTPLWDQVTKGGFSCTSPSFLLNPTSKSQTGSHKAYKSLLANHTTIQDTRMHGRLSPAKIAIVCAEHTQVLLMEKALGPLSKEILIDIQLHQRSIERALVFSFHPLNHMKHPSPFIGTRATLTFSNATPCCMHLAVDFCTIPSTHRPIEICIKSKVIFFLDIRPKPCSKRNFQTEPIPRCKSVGIQ